MIPLQQLILNPIKWRPSKLGQIVMIHTGYLSQMAIRLLDKYLLNGHATVPLRPPSLQTLLLTLPLWVAQTF